MPAAPTLRMENKPGTSHGRWTWQPMPSPVAGTRHPPILQGQCPVEALACPLADNRPPSVQFANNPPWPKTVGRSKES
jgi:hypothetical protein